MQTHIHTYLCSLSAPMTFWMPLLHIHIYTCIICVCVYTDTHAYTSVQLVCPDNFSDASLWEALICAYICIFTQPCTCTYIYTHAYISVQLVCPDDFSDASLWEALKHMHGSFLNETTKMWQFSIHVSCLYVYVYVYVSVSVSVSVSVYVYVYLYVYIYMKHASQIRPQRCGSLAFL